MTRGSPSDDPRLQAFDYLRDEAIDGHLAGDGMKVLHLCTAALEKLRRLGKAPPQRLDLQDVRWAFFLGLYWFLDDWFSYVANEALKHVATDELSSCDRSLIEYLLTTLEVPVSAQSSQKLASVSQEWLHARATDVKRIDDLAAMSLAIEFSWYNDPRSDAWRQLSSAWLAGAPDASLLQRELKRLIERLAMQGRFCTGDQVLPDADRLPAGTTTEQRQLVGSWRLFYEARFKELDDTLREVSSQVPVESPMYPAFFRLIQLSRMWRESSESQFISLSRVNLIRSRQPVQVVKQLRDERFHAAFTRIARAGFADNVAGERFTCFRMAMLNQLHALRSWDIGGWLGGEKQRAQIALELGARPDLAFARQGVVASVRSLSIRDPGKHPHVDRSIQLLDALSEVERRELVLELIATPRVLWTSAHRVIAELSDAIPVDTLAAVAEWSAQLELDEHHAWGALTRMEFWGIILRWAPNAAELIDVLKPALMAKASDPICWDALHATFIGAIVRGAHATATEILQRLVEARCSDPQSSQCRFSALYNVAEHRPEFAHLCLPWLEEDARGRNDQYQLFLLRRLRVPRSQRSGHAEFRKWLRENLIEYCNATLAETHGSYGIGSLNYRRMVADVTWPRSDRELVGKLIEVVDADYIPFTSKVEPIACLAVLARKGPKNQARTIGKAALKWLEKDIGGHSMGFGGPLSRGQMTGAGPEAVVPAFAFLLDALAQNSSKPIARLLSHWILVQGVRRSPNVVDWTICLTLRLSIALREVDEAISIALVGIAEAAAHAGFTLEPQKVISGFHSVLFSELPTPGTEEWLSAPAGKLCVEMWQPRLVDASRLSNPSVRESVARTIHKWSHSRLTMSEDLREARDRLERDCRLRVRAALAGNDEQT